MRLSVRWTTGAAVALSAGVALAACSSPHPSAESTTTLGTAASTTTTAPTTTSTVGGGAPAHCRAADLAVSVEGTQGAAGTVELTLQLRNMSGTTCTLDGYPGAQLYDSNGNAIQTTVVPGGSYNFSDFAPPTVTFAPGASGYVNMGYSDVPTGAGPCPSAASLWVTPPNAPDHLVVNQNFVVCNGKLTVSPVFGQGSPYTQTTAPPHP